MNALSILNVPVTNSLCVRNRKAAVNTLQSCFRPSLSGHYETKCEGRKNTQQKLQRFTTLCSTADDVSQRVGSSPLVVFSKTYCPYCGQVKGLFKSIGADFEAVELNQLENGADIQDALYDLTGQKTVPNVFIGGKHIGGCDDTVALHKKGGLLPLLEAAGVSISK